MFKIENEQFVIDESGGTEADLRAAVAACPSGAFKRVPANEPYLLKKMDHA